MGFFKKLKKVVDGVDKGAAIAAATLPGKAGQVAGEVGETAGVVTAVVTDSIEAASEVPPAESAETSDARHSVAVDDHEERVQELEKTIQQLQRTWRLRAALKAARSHRRFAGTAITAQAYHAPPRLTALQRSPSTGVFLLRPSALSASRGES